MYYYATHISDAPSLEFVLPLRAAAPERPLRSLSGNVPSQRRACGDARFQFAVRAVSGGSPRRRSFLNERIRDLCPLGGLAAAIETARMVGSTAGAKR